MKMRCVASLLVAISFPHATPRDFVGDPVCYLPFEPGTEVGAFYAFGDDERETANESTRYAIDFGPFPLRTAVVAMASGKVVFVKEGADAKTSNDRDFTGIGIELEDGSVTYYYPLMKGGARVAVGDKVLSGDRIGFLGTAGKKTGELWLRVDRRDSRGRKSLETRFAEAPADDQIIESGQVLKSRNRLRVGALADLVELQDDYGLAAGLGAQGAFGDDLRKLTDDAAAKRAATGLKKYEGRSDLPELFEGTRKRVLRNWNDDARTALSALDRAIAKGPPPDALLLARCALLDFGGSAHDQELKERLETLRAQAGATASEERFAAQAEFRKALGAALLAERNARRLMRADKSADWKTVEKLFRAALEKGAGRENLPLLQARIDAIPVKPR